MTDDTSTPTTPFGDPDGVAHVHHQQLTIEEVLASAKRVQTIGRVCLRADLQAERDAVITELSSLVNAQGELIADPDASMGEESPAQRAQELNERLTQLGRQMAGAMWSVRFEGLSSDDWPVFTKKHYPKGDDPDVTEFNTMLIAECAIAPTLTVDQVRELRKVLGSPQMGELAKKAWEANTKGGIDVPKSPVSLQAMTQR